VFTSRALIEDNEREIRKAQHALHAAEATTAILGSQRTGYRAPAGEFG
jgi:hypothetical protein